MAIMSFKEFMNETSTCELYKFTPPYTDKENIGTKWMNEFITKGYNVEKVISLGKWRYGEILVTKPTAIHMGRFLKDVNDITGKDFNVDQLITKCGLSL